MKAPLQFAADVAWLLVLMAEWYLFTIYLHVIGG